MQHLLKRIALLKITLPHSVIRCVCFCAIISLQAQNKNTSDFETLFEKIEHKWPKDYTELHLMFAAFETDSLVMKQLVDRASKANSLEVGLIRAS